MYYTGFADEAANDLAGQIRATRELGWQWIESRCIDGVNIHDLSDAAFDAACCQLADSGIGINCFGSTVANWACHALSEEEYQQTVAALERALVRMAKLNCKMIRGMSFRAEWERPAFDPEIEAWIFPRLERLVKMCADAGVLYLHENCNNYGGMSWKHTLKLVEKIDSPAFRLVFDTGNPVMNYDRSGGDELTGTQSAWKFYSEVKEFISYIHIKDGILQEPSPKGFGKVIFTWPGEGEGDVKRIVNDLVAGGYDGGISIEPHMAKVFHDENGGNPEEFRYNNYVEYGRRLMTMVNEAKPVSK